MPVKPIDPTEYERQTAIVTHTIINRSLEISYPHLSMEDIDAMFIGIVDRLARMRGYTVRREFVDAEEGE